MGTSLSRTTGNSIVNRSINQMNGGVVSSKSTSVVSSLMKEEDDSENLEKLPCEFCEEMIPMYKLLSHQAECVNPSNVRENGSSSSYRAYSSLRSGQNDSLLRSSRREGSTARERSLTRSASMTTNSLVSKHVKTQENGETYQNGNSRESESYRKMSSNSNSILDRYSSSSSNGHKRDDYVDSGTSSYMGRSSYLRQEREDARSEQVKIKKSASSAVVAGMYENDQDREGLRQILNGLRRDPMDVEDDPDNNDGSFFPCEFCGDPYPCEFLMRHQVRN